MSARDLILLVEDNEANWMLASAVLEREGFQVEVATAPEGVREWARRVQPDLILMDVQLPGQDGMSLTRELKSDPRTARIPVVALTAHAMAGDRERAIEAGCEGYVSKPIDTRTFGEQVRQFLAGSRQAAAS
jgi:CheY-like chemotaxis protein